MKVVFDSKIKSIVRFDKDDELIECLAELAASRDASFTFSMIGGAASIELGFYQEDTKNYTAKNFSAKNIEILNITGNVAWFEGKPLPHAHGLFSGEDYVSFGGHILKLVFSLTGETVIEWLPEKLKKEVGSNGLKLLC